MKDIIEILKKGGIGVMPTDTIYGLVGSAMSQEAVDKIYQIKKRQKDKPFIILISSPQELSLFGADLPEELAATLKNLWPAKVSVILPVKSKKMSYLHRGKDSLAFRLPKDRLLRKLLRKTGPLVAPSANLEGKPPAKSIAEARKYFGKQVDFYLDKGIIEQRPSIILEVKRA